MSACHAVFPISDQSQIGEARRAAIRMAENAGLGKTDSGKVAIIASELATNLIRHAKTGEILLRAMSGGTSGIEMLSVDRGPGMASVARCLEDGFSTAGTPGNGLGAIQRLSTHFDIASTQQAGTVVVSQLHTTTRGAKKLPVTTSAINRPAPGETVCGDSWSIAEENGVISVLMVDGLGHGIEAAKASDAAVAAFDQSPFDSLTEIMQRIDRQMRGTRGGAVAVARLELEKRSLRYLGVGNIAARLIDLSGASRGLVSHNGTVGVQIRKLQEFEYPLPAAGLLVLHSDGLQQRWMLDKYPNWPQHHPAVLAGLLYRDHTRGRDDVTVAALRIAPAA
jgi:anti-sigma regulatory factor (Ser/Thr protein kinase)